VGKKLSFSLAVLVGLHLGLSACAQAAEADVLARIRDFFATESVTRRAALAAEIAADPSYDRAKVSQYLHAAGLWQPLPSGRRDIVVPVGLGSQREVTLRIPRGYTPNRAWPLIYLLHPSGGNGPAFLPFAEATLGGRVEDYVVVAPSRYRQTGLDAPAPFTMDHTSILRAVRTLVHVDATRQFVLGYSLGGYASWAVAYLHSEEMAGAVPVGSCFSQPPTADDLWRALLPNFAYVPVLNVWGGRDAVTVYATDGRPLYTIAECNRRFIAWTEGMTLPITHHEQPDRGHGDLTVPGPLLEQILANRRPAYPAKVDHTFRHVHQGRAYWLEAHSWEGPHWGEGLPPVDPGPGESDDEAFGRAVRERLGRLSGEVKGQVLSVQKAHVQSLTVWLGDGMVHWGKPVTLKVNGKNVFTGKLQPDLFVCLTQAARTRDFDRLRWAGLRAGSKPKATVVTGKTPFPPLTAP
jgi:predicted esterase